MEPPSPFFARPSGTPYSALPLGGATPAPVPPSPALYTAPTPAVAPASSFMVAAPAVPSVPRARSRTTVNTKPSYTGHTVSKVVFLSNGTTGDEPPLVVSGGGVGGAKGDLRLWYNPGFGAGAAEDDALLHVLTTATKGSVTALASGMAVDKPALFCGTALGSTTLYTLTGGAGASLDVAWEDNGTTESVRGAVTGTDVHSRSAQAASVGEDSTVAVLDLEAGRRSWSGVAPHGCALNCVSFQSKHTVLTGGSYPGGQLCLWDIRAKPVAPARVFRDVTPGAGVFGLALHPVTDTIAVTGSTSGALSAWDLREASQRLSCNVAHSSTVWQVAFNPARPALVYSAGDDGRLLQWDFNHDRAIKPSADAANPYQLYEPLPSRAGQPASAAHDQLFVSDQSLNGVAVNVDEVRALGDQRCTVVAGGDSGSLAVCQLELPSPLDMYA